MESEWYEAQEHHFDGWMVVACRSPRWRDEAKRQRVWIHGLTRDQAEWIAACKNKLGHLNTEGVNRLDLRTEVTNGA